MAGRGVTTSDITAALNNENIESPGGEVRNDQIVMSVRTARSYNVAEDFEYLVVKRASDNTPIYLKDVLMFTSARRTKTRPLRVMVLLTSAWVLCLNRTPTHLKWRT